MEEHTWHLLSSSFRLPSHVRPYLFFSKNFKGSETVERSRITSGRWKISNCSILCAGVQCCATCHRSYFNPRKLGFQSSVIKILQASYFHFLNKSHCREVFIFCRGVHYCAVVTNIIFQPGKSGSSRRVFQPRLIFKRMKIQNPCLLFKALGNIGFARYSWWRCFTQMPARVMSFDRTHIIRNRVLSKTTALIPRHKWSQKCSTQK